MKANLTTTPSWDFSSDVEFRIASLDNTYLIKTRNSEQQASKQALREFHLYYLSMSFVMYPDRTSAGVLLVCADLALSEPCEFSPKQVAVALCDDGGSHTLISTTFWTYRLAHRTVMTCVTHGARMMPSCIVMKKRSRYVAGPDLGKMIDACREVLVEVHGKLPQRIATWIETMRQRATCKHTPIS